MIVGGSMVRHHGHVYIQARTLPRGEEYDLRMLYASFDAHDFCRVPWVNIPLHHMAHTQRDSLMGIRSLCTLGSPNPGYHPRYPQGQKRNALFLLLF